MKRKAYPNYKPSGVEWLGEVPEHWDAKAIKWTSPVLRGASPRPIDDQIYFDEEGEYAWVRIADVTASGAYLEKTEQQLSKIGSSLSVKLQPGSLFLSIAATVGVPCIAKIKCCIHDGFVYFPRLKSCIKFMFYIFACGEPYKGLGKMGTQLNLNTDTVGSIVIGFPPPPEQQAIAAYLDRETNKIDSLIAKKQRLLSLLAERRTALISRAVTKGLNSNAKMKPSGVEWLGEVPEHWDIWKLSQLTTRIGSGKTPSGGADIYQSEGILFLRSQNIYDNGLFLDDVVFIDEKTDEEMAWSRVQAKDILLNITGASLGRTCISPKNIGRANVNQHVCVIRLREKEYSNFIALFLKSKPAKAFYDFVQTGAAREGLNFEQIGSFSIPVPPLPEQQSIAAYLDRETAKIDALSSKVETIIERLKEYRTALISEAVTGKIDVREAV